MNPEDSPRASWSTRPDGGLIGQLAPCPGEAEQDPSAVGAVMGALDQSAGLQGPDQGAHRLGPDVLRAGELGGGRGGLPVQSRERGRLGLGQLSGHRALPHPALEQADAVENRARCPAGQRLGPLLHEGIRGHIVSLPDQASFYCRGRTTAKAWHASRTGSQRHYSRVASRVQEGAADRPGRWGNETYGCGRSAARSRRAASCSGRGPRRRPRPAPAPRHDVRRTAAPPRPHRRPAVAADPDQRVTARTLHSGATSEATTTTPPWRPPRPRTRPRAAA